MTALFIAASCLNAVLLFSVQPMTAKMLLPLFGGTAAVWTVCMLFYQAALLAGYAYAHALATRLSARAQAAVHLGALAAAGLALPPGPPAGWAPPEGAGAGALLWVLARAAGLPFLALAAGAPLLQRWYARAGEGRSEDPYFLYAASNLGSLAALLGYPFVAEPLLDLPSLARLWSWGYAALWLVWAACAARSSGPAEAAPAAVPAPWRRRLLWAALAAVPSSLMLGVTTHLTTDIAPAPLLWVVPLAVYLATFIAAFSSAGPAVTGWTAAAAPLAALAWAFSRFLTMGTVPDIMLHLGVLAMLAAALHGRLAAGRPGREGLTGYYLWVSFGGAAGGLFNGLLAPVLFASLREYPLAVVAAVALLPDELFPPRPGDYVPPERPWWRPALVVAALTAGLCWSSDGWVFSTIAGWINDDLKGLGFPAGFYDLLAAIYRMLIPAAVAYHYAARPRELRAALAALVAVLAVRQAGLESWGIVERRRDFYGVMTVRRDPQGRWQTLLHGNTIHGRQFLDPARADEPLTYFHRSGPAGDIFAALGEGAPRRFAVVGLGAGSMAAYAERGDAVTFYELDPQVEALARRHFTYLSGCERRGAALRVVHGDARLSLAREAARGGEPLYDLLAVDAFSSDSIPVHLVTREALALYVRRVSPKGLIAFHVTNRHLRLARAFARLAAEAGLSAARRYDDDQAPEGKYASEWVVLARDPEALRPLALRGGWDGMRPTPRDPLWTDAASSLLPLLK